MIFSSSGKIFSSPSKVLQNPLEAFASPLEAFAYSLDVPAACLEGFSTGNIDRKPACKEQAFEKESLGQPA
jgi:hypothetical protein